MEFTSREAIKFERMSEEEQEKNPDMKAAYTAFMEKFKGTISSAAKKSLEGLDRYKSNSLEYYPEIVQLHSDSIKALAVAIAKELKK